MNLQRTPERSIHAVDQLRQPPNPPQTDFFQMIEQLTRVEIDLLSETLGVRS
jgi:hypothetical protein